MLVDQIKIPPSHVYTSSSPTLITCITPLSLFVDGGKLVERIDQRYKEVRGDATVARYFTQAERTTGAKAVNLGVGLAE